MPAYRKYQILVVMPSGLRVHHTVGIRSPEIDSKEAQELDAAFSEIAAALGGELVYCVPED